MDEVKKLTDRIIAFRDARDWKQFHNPKDLSLSLVLEATEVMEHFQWKSAGEIEEYIKTNKADIGEELADVLYWVLLMGRDLDIDVLTALDADPARVTANSQRNAAEALLRHEWVYRWKEIFRVVGVEPSPGLVARERHLKALADLAVNAAQSQVTVT